MTRSAHISDFLAKARWEKALHHPLAGDASARRYIRLTQEGRSAILMDAPPETCGSMASFVAIAEHLKAIGTRPPEIFAKDLTNGLILMEDFGDDLMARRAESCPSEEEELYQIAVDVLRHIARSDPPDTLKPLTTQTLTEMVDPFFEFCAPLTPQAERIAAKQALGEKFDALPKTAPRLALRDYHAENLVLIAGETGLDRLGLLDFQDAIVTHPVYDLASLLLDARRDVPADIEERMILRFVEGTELSEKSVRSAYATFGLQRNLRILGIFRRLAEQHGKTGYLAYMPRVWRHVAKCLSDPNLADLRPFFDKEAK